MKRYENTENSNGKLRPTSYAVMPAVITPLAFLFQFGFSIGSLNSVSYSIKEFFNAVHMTRYDEVLSDSESYLLWSFTTSGFPIGGAFASIFISILERKFGQRKSMLYSQTLCISGTLLVSLAKTMKSHEALIIGNVLLGMYCAIGAAIGPSYVNDITIPKLQGTMGGLFSVFITFGIFIGNLFGLKQLLGTDSRWPFLLAFNAIPSIVFMLYFKKMPENPRSVFSKTRDEKKTLSLLSKLYGSNNVENVVEEYKLQSNSKIKIMTIWQVLVSPSVRWQLISAIIIICSLQISGINGVMYNLYNVLEVAGLDRHIVPYISVGISVTQVASSVISGYLAKKFGRKSLFLTGNGILAASCVLYTLTLAFLHAATWLPYLAILSTATYAAGMNVGSGVTAFSITPEILPLSARPGAMGIALFWQWIAFVAVSFATPYMFIGLKFGAMLPYLVITILMMIYVYIVVPETKGKSPSAIEKFFQHRRNTCCQKSFESIKEESEGNIESAEQNVSAV